MRVFLIGNEHKRITWSGSTYDWDNNEWLVGTVCWKINGKSNGTIQQEEAFLNIWFRHFRSFQQNRYFFIRIRFCQLKKKNNIKNYKD